MSDSNLNIKPRLVYCPTCKVDRVNDWPVPRCSDCGSKMLIVVFSLIDGSRITGVINNVPDIKS